MAVYNLPQPATPFVGRLAELSAIAGRLNDPNCRLLTLVGPGGIGKTRLAIQVAARYANQFDGGIYFASFQALNSPDFMVSAIAEAVGFQFHPGDDPQTQLLDYLREREVVLVLDNLEHLLDGAKLLSAILQVASRVRILTTSRERLSLVEEWVFEVRELAYPMNESETDIETYDAVQLFVQHARRMRTDFALTSREKPAVIRLCRLVGGMPLGIELAAAWVRSLSYEEIAHEIEHGLDILESSARNIEPRHRTIRAAFEPMWNHLSEKQRGVFRKLSVFRGGFTRNAAEHIAGASLHTLSTLVDRSLVRMDHSGRYDLHELLRQYAEERLREAPGELKEVSEKHCRYFTAVLAHKENDLEGRRQKEALEEIQCEIDNVRAAWAWAVEHRKESEIVQATHALWFFYDTRGWYLELKRVLWEAAEALGVNGPDEEKGRALGIVLAHYGYLETTHHRKVLEESVTILRRHNAHEGMGFALLRLSELAMYFEDDPLGAQDYLRESLTLFEEVGHEWGVAYSLRWLGMAAFLLEDYAEGRRLTQKSLVMTQESHDQWGVAIFLSTMGFCMLELGEFAEAKRVGQESLALCRDIGLEWASANAMLVIGAAACALKEYSGTRQYLYDGLEIAAAHHISFSILAFSHETANLMTEMGKREQASTILAFVLHQPVPPLLGRHRTAHLLARLQCELPTEIFAVAVERGERLELETAIEACRNFLRVSTETLQTLTERELEILSLIADGSSNRDIASNLIFSVGTVKWYVHQIYSKLGVSSRTQAIARARELNLLP